MATAQQLKYPTPRNATDVTKLLTNLDLPIPDRDGFVAISLVEGTRFSETVASLANSLPGSERSSDYVRNVLAATHPDTRRALMDAGYPQVDLSILIDIAKREGRSFRHAVSMLTSTGASDERDLAVNYLRGLASEYGLDLQSADVSSLGVCQASRGPVDTGESCKPSSSSLGQDKRIAAIANKPQLQQTKGRSNEGAGTEYGESIHVYAGSAAICFAEVQTRQGGKSTVVVEVAKAEGGQYAWKDKIIFMLTLSELPLVLGVFLGYLDKLELKGHGNNQEKALSIDNQGNQFFLKIITRGQPPRAVPIPAMDSYQIVCLLLAQMQRNDHHLPVAIIMQLAKHICDMHSAPRANPGGRHD